MHAMDDHFSSQMYVIELKRCQSSTVISQFIAAQFNETSALRTNVVRVCEISTTRKIM